MKIKDAKVYTMSDLATIAQHKVQADFPHINPVISISHHLRKSGFAADTMTIQHHACDKRIIFVLHDDSPGTVDIEFGKISEDPSFEFESFSLENLTEQQFYTWMSQSLT
jgi:hypothetical protein